MNEAEIDYYRNIAINYARMYIGDFYSWGGNTPDGFDCSGLVIEILKAVGIVDRKIDITAAGLYEMFKQFKTDIPKRGCLVLWYNDKKQIVHVEVCIDYRLSLGASGGGSATKTKEDAIRDGAFIKIRPIMGRGRECVFVDPFMALKDAK